MAGVREGELDAAYNLYFFDQVDALDRFFRESFVEVERGFAAKYGRTLEGAREHLRNLVMKSYGGDEADYLWYVMQVMHRDLFDDRLPPGRWPRRNGRAAASVEDFARQYMDRKQRIYNDMARRYEEAAVYAKNVMNADPREVLLNARAYDLDMRNRTRNLAKTGLQAAARLMKL